MISHSMAKDLYTWALVCIRLEDVAQMYLRFEIWKHVERSNAVIGLHHLHVRRGSFPLQWEVVSGDVPSPEDI